MTRPPRAIVNLLLPLAALFLLPQRAAAQPGLQAHFSHAPETVAARARRVPPGGTLRLAGVPLRDGGQNTLLLERFEVFTPDAELVVHGVEGAERRRPPERAYFRGELLDDPASVAFVSIAEDGSVRGFVQGRGRLHLIGQEEGAGPLAPLVARALEDLPIPKGLDPAWSCSGGLEPPVPEALGSLFAPAESREVAEASFTSLFSTELAIETDFELYALFGNVHAAAGYVGDLVGAISALYYRDIGTTLKVRYLSFWTAKGAGYPWGPGTSSCVTLAEFGNFWHTSRSNVPRDTAHFLSGRPSNNGIAWVGVLCNGDFPATLGCNGSSYSTWGGGYGVTHGIDGVFSLTNPAFFWDIAATAHELGHNFNSPHTHCYNDVPTGGAPPVDQCFSGECKQSNQQGQCVSFCYQGPTSVPSGGGTIMSYCQLRPGGYNNVNLSFGQAGLYGTQSERVPARMRSFVESRSCLSFLPARAADFDGEGRSDVVLRRADGDWIFFPLWPGK